MKTRKIGERFDFGARTLEVVEGDDRCDGCFFKDADTCCMDRFIWTGPCVPNGRDDKKWVIFKEIK